MKKILTRLQIKLCKLNKHNIHEIWFEKFKNTEKDSISPSSQVCDKFCSSNLQLDQKSEYTALLIK